MWCVEEEGEEDVEGVVAGWMRLRRGWKNLWGRAFGDWDGGWRYR